MNELGGANEVLLVIGTTMVLLALIPAIGILRTWSQVPWRDSDVGQVLHSKALSIAEVLVLSLIGGTLALLDIGRPWWFEALRVLAFGHVMVSLWWQWRTYKKIIRSRAITHPVPR